jgi:hypothetical protein
MGSLCLSDLPVSGQITAFAISGMMVILLLRLTFSRVLFQGVVGKEKQLMSFI